MVAIRLVIARMRALFRRNATADEIREELEFHVAMRADEYGKRGLDPRAARQAAIRRFGNLAVIQDRGYDIRGGGLLETIFQDVKYGVRQLGQHPSFSLVAVLTLALGIGVSTALFSVIDAALLRPLPYPNPEELVTLSIEDAQQRPGTVLRLAPSMADIRRWRTLTTIVAHAGSGRVTGVVPLIVETGTPQRLTVAEASEDFLETYGVSPMLGRGIQLEDTREGALQVALLGHAFWQRDFGGDPNVLALQPEYDRGVTHAAFEITSVTRNGKLHNVSDDASAGPLALWAIRQAISGLAESATWGGVARQPSCPAPFAR